MSITMEQILRVLNFNKNIDVKPQVVLDDLSYFNRNIEFTLREVNYNIEWWYNHSFLNIGEAKLLYFTDMEIISTYPNEYKYNLAFFQGESNVMIIPVEEYAR